MRDDDAEYEYQRHENSCQWKIRYEGAIGRFVMASITIHEMRTRGHFVTLHPPYHCQNCDWTIDNEGRVRYTDKA